MNCCRWIMFHNKRFDLRMISLCMFVLIAVAAVLMWQQHRQTLAGQVNADISNVLVNFHSALNKEISNLTEAIQPIAGNTNVKKSLREGNADQLLTEWQTVFAALKSTQISFFDKNRVCLLRVHKPEKRGDLIERFTALEAERTGKTASGIELDSMDIFTLRVVQPVFEGDALVGYVELGKEINAALQSMYVRSDIQLGVLIHKECLNRQKWEDGMRLFGRQADWDRLPHKVVTYTSMDRLPDAFASWADQLYSKNEKEKDILFEGKAWRLSAIPLKDSSEKYVGDLLIMRDITAEKAALSQSLTLGGAFAFILLTLLLSFVYILHRRTDAGIRTQRAALLESEERYAITLAAMNDGLWDWHIPSGKAFFSKTYYEMLGYEDGGFFPSYNSWRQLVHPDDIDNIDCRLRECIKSGKRFNIDFRIKTKSGEWLWVSTRGKTVEKDADGNSQRMVGTLTDITELKLSEAYREIGREILQILNESGNLQNSIHRVIDALKTRTGFDAVGIRMKDGDDFPYFIQQGFPDDFLLTENTLLECAADGRVCRGKDGKVRLECICGLIISGNTDPSNHLFTRGGSFWTNDSSLILKNMSNNDLRVNPRNRCIYEGYASIALVPIRNKDKIVGLLQFNDRRKGCFSLDTVELIEEVASRIGESLMRKVAEDVLQAKTALLKAQTNASLDGILIVDEKNKKSLVNHRLFELFKVPADIIDDDDDTSLVNHLASLTKDPEQFIEKVKWLYNHIMETSRDEIEFNDGTVLDRYSAPVLDDEGKYYGRIWTFRDITGKKQAEQKLKASENRYRMLFDKMSEGLALHEIICDENGKPVDSIFLDVNLAYEEITGMKKNMIVGRKRSEVLPKTEHSLILEYGEIALNGTHKTFERDFSSEFEKYFLITAYSPQQGQFATLLVDITERRQMQLKLEMQLNHEKAFSSILSKLVKVDDFEEAITHSISAICDSLPKSHCCISILGDDMKPIYNWSTDNSDLNLKLLMSELPGLPEMLRHEKTIILPSSCAYPKDEGCSLIIPMNIGNDKLGILKFDRCDGAKWGDEDIKWLKTGASLLETLFLLNESKKELEFRQHLLTQADKMVSLGILVAGVAHEINNPNNAIMLNIPIIQKIMEKAIPLLDEKENTTGDFNISGMPYSDLKGEIPFLFTGVMESSNRIKAIVDGLKEYARETPHETREKIKIPRILDSCLKLLSHMTKQTVENICVDCQENIPLLTGNFQQIEQVLINLIQNACESDPGRKIKLKITAMYDSKQKRVVIKVIDNGKGISEKNLKLLTDPFFTTKRNSGGTGLGLSISAGIVKEHGGELMFESQEGAGTTAIVTLPLDIIENDK